MAVNDKEMDYRYAQEFFAQWDSLHDASTWHGWLCGYIAAQQGLSSEKEQEPWFQQAMMWLDIAPVELRHEDEIFLKAFFTTTALAMTSKDSWFMPLLPEAKVALSQRVSCISFWAESFLLGFAATPLDQMYLDKETQDALRDMAEISQIDMDEGQDAELEEHFNAVVEHLGVLVRVIYARESKAPKTLH